MEEPINANETIYHDTLVVPPELEEDELMALHGSCVIWTRLGLHSIKKEG